MEHNGESLDTEQTARLRESLDRYSAETVEAVLHFRREHDLVSALAAVHGIIDRHVRPRGEKPLAEYSDTVRLGEEIGIDSLTLLQIVMSIEEALDFQLDATHARPIRTLGDLRRYIDDRVHNRPALKADIEAYDRERLWVTLPQQPPFLLLERASLQGDEVWASCRFKGDEFFFSSRVPNGQIVPTSIILEALAQACCLWILEHASSALHPTAAAKQVSPAAIEEIRFLRHAVPGDEIQISLHLVRLQVPQAIFEGEVKVHDQLLARVRGLTVSFESLGRCANNG